MSQTARSTQVIMAERLALVAEVTGINARQLRNIQLVGGLEIELLACQRALAEAQARDREVRAEIARDEEQLDRLDQRLTALDRELART
jgi:hypothetical protein